MSTNEQGHSEGETPTVEAIRAINARIDKVEGQQRQDEEEERRHNKSQLRVNRTIAIFTALLFATSTVSDVYLIRQTGIARDSADAAKSAAETADNSLKLTFRPRLSIYSLDSFFVLQGTNVPGESVPRPNLTPDRRLNPSISIKNIGPATATDVHLFRYDGVGDKDSLKPLTYVESLDWQSFSLLPSEVGRRPLEGTKSLTSTEIKDLRKGTKFAVFSVRMTYKGDLPGIHHAESCAIFNFTSGATDPCPWSVQND